MRKHKNLNKQELMIRQDIPCVHLGGKFVPLESRVKSLLGEKRKKRAEKVLATVVMGMNLVNVTAPVAALAAAGKTVPAPVQPLRSDAAPLDYAVLPQLADVVDRAIFARAEATDYSGNASVATMVKGDTQTITSGQNGIVSVMSGDVNGAGLQTISSGGTGTVSKMDGGGTQFVSSGGIGTVIDMNGGYQTVYEGGTGKVETMDGLQYISGGVGSVGTMNGNAGQFIYSGGTGMINELNSYQQYVNEGCTGIINIMNTTGTQWISANAVGTVVTLKSGTQLVDDGGTGTIITLDNHDGAGGQIVYSNAIGTIVTMLDGEQYVFKGGSATVVDMSGGTQIVRVSGNGMIETLNGGEQNIMGGGTGLVSTMNSGSQVISSSGTGTVDTLNGGTQTVAGGGNGTVSTMLGGTQVVSSSGKGTVNALNGGTQIVSVGGTSLDTVLNSGGEQLILNGGTALDTELNGGIMQMSSGGIVSGMTMTGGSMVLENIDGGSFNINGTLTANNAVIDMTDSSVTRAGTPAYESLTIDTLSGSGTTFILDTDLAGEANSDKVTITHADVGTHYVQIKDLSKLNNIEVTGEHKQLLITDASGKLTFVGKEFNAGGLWDVDPTLSKGDALGLSANDWYLTNMVKTVNNDTSVLLDAADNSYAMWRNTNDSLRSRLGALASGREQADGVWARTQAGRFSGSGYEGRYNLYQLGFEKQFKGGSIYGGAIDYGDGSGSYAPGSSKDNLRSFSLYGIWTAGSGAYTNVTARVGNFSTDLESYGDYPDKASYKQHAYSLSVEYGKRFDFEAGFFVEPQAQFTLGRLAGIDYTTDRGVNGRIDGMNSAIGRIGFVMGQKIENGSDIYLKADLLHEFAGERNLQLTSDAGGTNDILTKHNDYGDTWFELGLGGNVRISRTGNFYGEVTRGFGGDINKKWSVNAGLRFTF
ncbi:autotransporter outer membrane beta-barrel domain-containing protein [Phascolarctobacterium sp.]|uniref:autotransporter outer membrane beta-barrel domain-containing protein n=1 Tax=Phascolarctobacterium sp. TaxID=2049039 RepID=UPI00257B2DF5|nr:autotransporter outer membrane beta-barrel domain-containing protein [Phascolarctobacterium sp.]MBS6904531.1 autotransporter outer membrane beta-barrel domain-containing protein [Phascolarctobacterium sp.]